jgi:hypothetical protein
MLTIKANCREQLTEADFRFLASVLTSNADAPSSSLTDLLVDPGARDAALENDRVFRALIDSPQPISVSPQLYFYVLTRHLLSEFDREIADYVASVLCSFLDVQRLRALPNRPELDGHYVVDALAALAVAPPLDEFHIRVHVGNYTLFVTGIFPEHLRHRAAFHGAPDLPYYEEVGRASYRFASDHQLARHHALNDVYRTISDHFPKVRRDLNRLSDELLCVEPPWSIQL